MRKYMLILVVILCVLLINNILVLSAEISLDNSSQIYYDTYNAYDLIDYNLRLPNRDNSQISRVNRKETEKITSLYNEGLILDDSDFNLYNSLDYNREIILEDINQGKKTQLEPLPGLLLEADYQEGQKELSLDEMANISLKYLMDNRTTLRAEYDLNNKESSSERDINNSSETDIIEDEQEKEIENTNSRDTGKKNAVGITYQTTDELALSADFVDDDILNDDGFGTMLGIEYNNNFGQLRYHYLIEHGSERTTESGVELGFKDIGTFNASYKTGDRIISEEKLFESIWDFGVDLNLNDISSLSIDYQLKDGELEDIIKDKESNIKAQLEIQF